MAESEVTTTDITSIDPESIVELLEFRNYAIDAFVGFYAKNFDKIMGKLGEGLNAEKSNKLKEIREKHLKDYESYIENCLDQQMRQLFEVKTIGSQLVYISDNFDKFPSDLISVQTAIEPFRQQFVQQLKDFQQKVIERHESKTKTLTELTESLSKTHESYESLRKSVQTKVLTTIKELDSFEVQDLEISSNTK